MKIAGIPILAAALLLCAVAPLQAQPLYKLVGKDGKVTYTQTPPKDFDGQVTRVDIDSKTNTMDAPKLPPKAEGKSSAADIIRRPTPTSKLDRVRAARQNMEKVCGAYENARDNPGEGDVEWIARGAADPRFQPGPGAKPEPPKAQPPTNNPTLPAGSPPPPPVGAPPAKPPPGTAGRPLGARPVPTAEYQARVADLERDCSAARENLARAEREP